MLKGARAEAMSIIERALALNPNCARAWRAASLHCFENCPTEAIDAIHRAIRLSPLDPQMPAMHWLCGYALIEAGQYEEALPWVDRCLHAWPNHHPAMRGRLALCGYLARREEATEWIKRILAVNPGHTVGWFRDYGSRFLSASTVATDRWNAQGRLTRMTEQRRLAAILVADVVGYSKLIGSDEAGTLAQLEALRTEIIEPQIAKHAGRLFKSVGDGFFIEFASAVQAVSCAKAIQEANDLGTLAAAHRHSCRRRCGPGRRPDGRRRECRGAYRGHRGPRRHRHHTRGARAGARQARSWLHGQGRDRAEEHPAASAGLS